MDWIDGELILIGKKSDKKYLVRMNTEGVSREPITFPEIELKDIRIVKNNGNLFIKSRTAIVFLYNDSRDIKWLIDGEILAFSELGAIYRKD